MTAETIEAGPELRAVYDRRIRALASMREDPGMLAGARAWYADKPLDFIDDWVDTFDPRLISRGLPGRLPFQLYPKQREMVEFVSRCLASDASGLIEKSRDVGATWTCCAYSVWLWLFKAGVTVGWGSRKAEQVDRLGDPSAIFEKMRAIIDGLPFEFLPKGFRRSDHLLRMRLMNPENGAIIAGEGGDQIGRGARTSIYFVDESAHLEHAELIEAALSETSRCRIDISSVAGTETVFQRKREAGADWTGGEVDPKRTNVFTFSWQDHPLKDAEWYEDKRAKAEAEGLEHIHAQEVDMDPFAAAEDILIPRPWVRSAVDLHLIRPDLLEGGHMAGLDIADAGADRNALVIRKGVTAMHASAWSAKDTGETARRAIGEVTPHLPMELQYDGTGVGSGVRAEANRLGEANKLPKGLIMVSWMGGSAPLDGDKPSVPKDANSPLIQDVYMNLKAQAWWNLRSRFMKAHRVRHQGSDFPADELISIDAQALGPTWRLLEKEVCQARRKQTPTLKQQVDKAPGATRSPDLADAMVMCFFPCRPAGAYTRALLDSM